MNANASAKMAHSENSRLSPSSSPRVTGPVAPSGTAPPPTCVTLPFSAGPDRVGKVTIVRTAGGGLMLRLSRLDRPPAQQYYPRVQRGGEESANGLVSSSRQRRRSSPARAVARDAGPQAAEGHHGPPHPRTARARARSRSGGGTLGAGPHDLAVLARPA